MTHEEMIENMRKKCGPNVPKTAMERSFKQVFSDIKDACASGNAVSIRNFGIFYIKDCQQRTGRNPQTGTPISIPARKKIAFRNSAALKKLL